MKNKKSILMVAGFITLAVFGLVYVVELQSHTPERPAGVFQQAGYQVLVPHVVRQRFLSFR